MIKKLETEEKSIKLKILIKHLPYAEHCDKNSTNTYSVSLISRPTDEKKSENRIRQGLFLSDLRNSFVRMLSVPYESFNQTASPLDSMQSTILEMTEAYIKIPHGLSKEGFLKYCRITEWKSTGKLMM